MTEHRSITATYAIEAADPEQAADVLAGEGSTGTFVRVVGEEATHVERFAIAVEDLTPTGDADADGQVPARLRVVLPEGLPGGDLTTLLASVAGNVSEVAQVSAVRLTDLQLSESFLRSCPGPRFGVAGTRALLGGAGGALTARTAGRRPTTADELALGVREALAAGADLLRDPSVAADPPGLPLSERIAVVEPLLAEHRERTGRGVLFTYTIDDEPAAMLDHAEAIAAAGGRAARVGAAAVGLTAVAHLRRRSELLIAARTAPAVVLTRCRRFGVVDGVLQAIWRLAGLDHVPVGAAHPDPAAGVRDRLTPLLDPGDRALPVVTASTEVPESESDIVVEHGR